MANLSIKVEHEAYDEFGVDALDDLPLSKRFKLAPYRELQGEAEEPKMSPKLPMDVIVKTEALDMDLQEAAPIGRSDYNVDIIKRHNDQHLKEQDRSGDRQMSTVRNDSPGNAKDNSSQIFKPPNCGSASSEIAKPSSMDPQYPEKAHGSQESRSPEASNLMRTQENRDKCLLAMPTGCKPPVGQGVVLCLLARPTAYKPPVGQKVVPSEAHDVDVSTLPTTLVNVKVETLESGLESHRENAMSILLDKPNAVAVKAEIRTWEESYEEVMDHMPLRQRRELLFARSAFELNTPRNLKCLRKNLPSASECNPSFSETGKPKRKTHRRKMKRSATDSVETALEEDAPGLLKALVDKGIVLDEIKLYAADMENEDALDVSSVEDSFGDLESVVSKLFFQRSSLLKLAPLQSTKLSKPIYCLACLLSLVEQTRYLQFRKWPVEWGWCRDLQSFIFVFERHNRIVLERPEYGYATYFFELVVSLPIDWQIKRLVIAMKLTSCSRTTLIENKSLLVGEDLSEGEARVLEEYGWAPNTGLGSMLNYCDRVVHDKKNAEENISEWRSKIGKLLINGLDGGSIVLTNIPKKFKGYNNNNTQDSTCHVKA